MAQEAPGQDLQSLRTLDDAIRNSEALLQKHTENDFTPTVMAQLAELYLKRSTLRFQREMLLYERAEEKLNQGLTSREPAIPSVDFSETIDISLRLLNKYPEVGFRDRILYRVALCYSEQGGREKAAEYFKYLTESTEDKALLEEAYFRLGEHYFDMQEFASAIDYYTLLLESWDNSFFAMALYKLGWSYYNVGNFSKSISTFIYLIEDISLVQNVEDAGQSRADLRREAIEYVAICFADFGGPAKIRKFLQAKKEQDYVEDVLAHLAELYRQRDFYAESIETLHILLDFYPNRAVAPHYQKQIIDNHELAGEKDQADMERAVLIEGFGPGSEWLTQVPNGPTRNEIVALAETCEYELGTEAQAKAQASGNRSDYQQAIGWYGDYLTKFSSFERAHKVQFYLGESQYEIKRYTLAANAYSDLLLNYPASEFAETAGYNRILAYNHLLQANPGIDSTDFFLFNFLGKNKGGVDILKARSGNQAQLMQACNDFYVFHPQSDKRNEVLMNFAELLFELKQYEMAKRIYAEVMFEPAGNAYLAQAYDRMAQSEFGQENYSAAESWYSELRDLFPDSTAQVARANKMIASAKFKKAESLLAKGDSVAAATAFAMVAETAPDTAVAERALLEAARQFETLGRTDEAIEHFEKVYVRFPKSPSVGMALFKAGMLCEQKEKWQHAATNYLNLFKHDRASKYAPRAVFAAARCYETAEHYDLAKRYYLEYTRAFTQDPDRSLEASFRQAEIAHRLGDSKAELQDLQHVVRMHHRFLREKVAVEGYFAANAQFLIAELSFDAFEKVKLEPPIERRLKRKQKLFRKVIKEYTNAAKYKVAEWTTAASYKIGVTFESFADALLSSPRPDGLSTEDLDKYNDKLWQRVLPFKEKARKAYEANLKNAVTIGIHNHWITESELRLNDLNIELGVSTIEINRKAGL